MVPAHVIVIFITALELQDKGLDASIPNQHQDYPPRRSSLDALPLSNSLDATIWRAGKESRNQLYRLPPGAPDRRTRPTSRRFAPKPDVQAAERTGDALAIRQDGRGRRPVGWGTGGDEEGGRRGGGASPIPAAAAER
jgi:hypothetical protein